jgi:hypothetical protein
MNMKSALFAASILAGLMFLSPTAGATEPFDPEQPFREAISQDLLRPFLKEAMEILEDHFEITGNVNQESKPGDERTRLRFRFYPEGKSKSDESITAEGWIDQSPNSRQQDLHFRFSLPRSAPQSTQPGPGEIL